MQTIQENLQLTTTNTDLAPTSEGKKLNPSLEQLKQSMSSVLISPEHVQTHDGVATGLSLIDDFLLWKGLPKGDISLIKGPSGSGATSLCIKALQSLQAQNKWAAWINSDFELLPTHLSQRGINLAKLLVVKKPDSSQKLFWAIQELISSQIFDVVGCHLQEFFLRNHQIQKLKKMARAHKVALILVCTQNRIKINPLFSLIIDCSRDFFSIQRALHRPTPYFIEGSQIYADLMPQLSKTARTLLR